MRNGVSLAGRSSCLEQDKDSSLKKPESRLRDGRNNPFTAASGTSLGRGEWLEERGRDFNVDAWFKAEEAKRF
ncbi:hypothetical protein P0Y35_10790 [Kiritimatiellaeota bacterium B1221]|nr:hypothetical protein [Kiritimatiellaeota bacterium B1221]